MYGLEGKKKAFPRRPHGFCRRRRRCYCCTIDEGSPNGVVLSVLRSCTRRYCLGAYLNNVLIINSCDSQESSGTHATEVKLETVRGHFLYINKVAISFSHYTINLTPLEKYHVRNWAHIILRYLPRY